MDADAAEDDSYLFPMSPQDEVSAYANGSSIDAEDEADADDAYFEGIYAIIMISGRLPDILNAYRPEATAHSGAASFEIPRAAAQALIDEISGADGVAINFFDERGTYALVYYTP